MKFGPTRLADAAGSILAHGVSLPDVSFKKGRVLSEADLNILAQRGMTSVIAATLGPDDVAEDQAAHAVALSASRRGSKAQSAFTGRANIYSSVHGVLLVDKAMVREINHLHESLTIATLPAYSVVAPKQMLATVKIIPFATPRAVLEKALNVLSKSLVQVASFQKRSAGLVITSLPHTKSSIIAKSEQSIRTRLEAKGATLSNVEIVPHDAIAVAGAIRKLKQESCDPILLFGATAIVDRADVIPQSLVDAGGKIVHLGMPVDPGNLLLMGQLGPTSVIGVPSCARSPKVNGFDWVLERVLAGLDVKADDLMDMGSGGLLAEIPSRPHPREKSPLQLAPRISAIVLAAGTSSRMGSNKMLANFNGQPMLRVTLNRVLQSGVDDVVVVTGHQAEQVSAVVADMKVRVVHNPEYAEGLSTSLRAGLNAIASDAALICLGDMPLIDADLIDRMIAAFNPAEHRNLVVPLFEGEIGNPVLWGAEHFAALKSLEGDRGARTLLDVYQDERVEIVARNSAVLRDADTPEALAALQNT